MADLLRFNVFRFAPRELSHTAFWAWLMQSIEAEDQPALRGPRRVALRLLQAHGVPPLRPPIRVDTEKWLNRRDRLDIRVEDAAGTVVAIENKVLATPDPTQVDRYRTGLGRSSAAHLLVLCTAFDEDVQGTIGCEYVGLAELVEAIRPYRRSHFLLGEYFEWLQALSERRKRLCRDALCDDAGLRAAALATPEGQWALMTRLTNGMNGRQYRDFNRGGEPWTEFRFVEQTSHHDALFYRIDRSAGGHQLQLKQYRDDVRPGEKLEPKLRRLTMLRSWWSDACESHAGSLRPAAFSDRGTKASVIGRFILADKPPRQLAKSLPALHKAFVRKLLDEGWPVTGGRIAQAR